MSWSLPFFSGQDQGYAMGGMVTPPAPAAPPPPQLGQGQPVATPGVPTQPMEVQQLDPNMLGMQLDQLLSQSPESAQRLQQMAAQMGITPAEAAQIGQMALLVMQNPALWPQVRMYAIQAFGLPPDEIPEQYDPQFVSMMAILAHVAGGGLTAPPAPQAKYASGGVVSNPATWAQSPVPSYANGGMILGPGTGTSDSVQTYNRDTGTPVSVSNGEYIIPAHVVKAVGTHYLDNMVSKHSKPSK